MTMLRPLLMLFTGLCLACARPAPPNPHRPLIFVGLDGADWQLLDAYAAAGTMPNLARLLAEGRSGALRSLDPPLSPLVWTTMMTGVSPLEHRILDFTRFSPATGEREPITSDERRAPAVWNLASAAGLEVAVLGMWATFPPEPVAGWMVSDRFSSFTTRGAEPPAGSVHPPELERRSRAILAETERSVDFAALAAYLPWLSQGDFAAAVADPDPYARPVSALRQILIETRVYHALARAALERRPPLLIAYFQGTDTLGHVFAPFAPPRQPAVTAADFERYSEVPARYFAEIDRLLGDYLRAAQETGAVLMLASDHGFLWGEGRPERLESLAAATAGRWHRLDGIYLLWGEGIAPDPARPSAEVAQVAPTLLALLGLPPLAGMPPPLAGIAPAGPAVAAAAFPTRQTIEETAPDPEALARLRALGYLGGSEPGARPAEAADRTRTPGSYNNEGLLLLQQGRREEAAAAFEQALALDPLHASALANLSELLPDAARADELLLEAVRAGLPEGRRRLAARAEARRAAGARPAALALLDRGVEIVPAAAELWLLRGRCHLETEACREARHDFERAAMLAPDNPVAHASLGAARLCLGDEPGALAALRRSLELDPDQPELERFFTPPSQP